MSERTAMTTTVEPEPVDAHLEPIGRGPDRVVPVERDELIAQLGTMKFTADQRKRLAEDVDPNIVAMKPTGEPYVPAVHYRRKLNAIFRSWGLRPVGAPQMDLRADAKGRSIMYREYALVINGTCAAVATGEAEYHPNNERMTYGDALEATRSNGLMRCCKDIGLYSECWDPKFAQHWRKQYCVQVWVVKGRSGDNRPQWRRLDGDPFLGEDRPTDESPNQEKYWALRAGVKKEPAPEPVAPKTAESDATEKIVAVRTMQRKDGATVYGLKTSAGDYYFDDATVYQAVEQWRLAGTPVRVNWEERSRSGKLFRWVLEVRG